ncbi:MAG: hypothetical protein GXO26_09040 [Crenarchaeota archaeon]|nr:hypothetical protein [Thermoproteota archaeon]
MLEVENIEDIRKILTRYEKVQIYSTYEEEITGLDDLRRRLRDNIISRLSEETYLKAVKHVAEWLYTHIFEKKSSIVLDTVRELALIAHSSRDRPFMFRTDRNKIIIGPILDLVFLDSLLNVLPILIEERRDQKSSISSHEYYSQVMEVLKTFEARLREESSRCVKIIVVSNIDLNYEEDLQATLILELAYTIRQLYTTGSVGTRAVGEEIVKMVIEDLAKLGYISKIELELLARTYVEHAGLAYLKRYVERGLRERKTLLQVLEEVQRKEPRKKKEVEKNDSHESKRESEGNTDSSVEEDSTEISETSNEGDDLDMGGEGEKNASPSIDLSLMREFLEKVEYDPIHDFMKILESDLEFAKYVRVDFDLYGRLIEKGLLTPEEVRIILNRFYHPRTATIKRLVLGQAVELTDRDVENISRLFKQLKLLSEALAYTSHGKLTTSEYYVYAIREVLLDRLLSSIVTVLEKYLRDMGPREIAEKILRGEFELRLV